MATERTRIEQWERNEIERSATQAVRSGRHDLQYSPKILARYLDPPATTCYPLEYAYHLLGDLRGKVVLDFGCGSGENTVLLARRGAQVIGMDISESLIRVAEQRLLANGTTRDVRFIVCSAHDLALADESIDVVFGIAILHHLDLALVSREVFRILRQGGRAIFLEPVRNSPVVRFVRRLIPYTAPDVSPFERPLTDGELATFAGGYRQYRSRAFSSLYVNLAELLPGVRRHVDRLQRFDRALLARFPALNYYATARVIEAVK